MKRTSLFGTVALLSGLLFSLMMITSPSAQDRAASSRQVGLRSSSQTNTPLRYTLRVLQVAAQSLNYFPKMERATAANHPTSQPSSLGWQAATVSLTGVGPVRIGMTLEEAEAALGLPLIPLGSSLGGECAYYQPDTRSQSLGLMVVDGRVIRIDIWPGSTLATVSGAAIGSTEAEVQQLYPDQIKATPNPYSEGQLLTLIPNDPALTLYGMVFETDATGQVVQYRTGQIPAVTWPDGCL